MTLMFLAVFVVLLPFIPVWFALHDEKDNHRWTICHGSLWKYLIIKYLGHKTVVFLRYVQVCEMYERRIKD